MNTQTHMCGQTYMEGKYMQKENVKFPPNKTKQPFLLRESQSTSIIRDTRVDF